MRMPPGSRSLRLVFRAAGFMATRVLSWSPGVWMSVEEKWIWKPETPARVPAGARSSAGEGGGADRGGEVGQGADVVAEQGRGVGQLGPCQLHAVAGIAR